MKQTLARVVTLCVVGLVAAGAPAQTPEEPQPVVTLRLTPAAPARPALKHALLYDQADLRPGNAAPLYFTATLLAAQARAAAGVAPGPGMGPPAAGATAGESERLDRYLSAPAGELERDRGDAQSLVSRYEFALHQAALGAQRDSCRWDLSIREDGPNTLLPQLPELRTLARLLSLRARLQILDRRYDDAAATLRTGLALARHLNEQAVLVQSVFAAGVAAEMLERAREFAAAPGAPNLYWPLSALPQPFVDPLQPMQWERSFVAFAVPDLARAARGELPPEQWQAVWRSVRDLASSMRDTGASDRGWEAGAVGDALAAAKAYPEAKKYLVSSGVPPERVNALPVAYVVGTYQYRRYQEWSDELWKGFVLPYWQGAGVMTRAARDMDRGEAAGGRSPFTALLPSLNLNRLRLAQVDRSIAALRVAEALRAHAAENDGRLPDSLDDVKGLPLPFDPVSGKPFRFERTREGAVLQAPRVPAEQTGPSPRFEISIVR